MTDTKDTASLKKQIETAADIIRDLIDKLTDQLEAERQRADDAERKNSLVAGGIESALKLQERAEKAEDEVAALKTDIESYISISGELATEVEVLKAKLANPVVLTDCTFEAVSHMAHWYSEGECVAWVSGAEHVKKQILEAGFTVKGDL